MQYNKNNEKCKLTETKQYANDKYLIALSD